MHVEIRKFRKDTKNGENNDKRHAKMEPTKNFVYNL